MSNVSTAGSSTAGSSAEGSLHDLEALDFCDVLHPLTVERFTEEFWGQKIYTTSLTEDMQVWMFLLASFLFLVFQNAPLHKHSDPRVLPLSDERLVCACTHVCVCGGVVSVPGTHRASVELFHDT